MRIDLISVSIAGTLAATAGFQAAGAPPSAPSAGAPINQPPQCFAQSPDRVACNGDLVTFVLDGSASFDPDNDPLTYLWTTGCPSAVIADPTAAVTTMTVDSSSTCESACSIRLRVSDGTSGSSCRTFVSFEPLEVSFGFAPGVCPNAIVIEGDGGGSPGATTATLPTSLIGSKAFDPMTVDLGTIRLGRFGDNFLGGSVTPIGFEFVDVATPFEGEFCECNPLAGDGFMDLLVTFDLDEVIDQLGLANEPDGSVVPLEITGALLDGTLTVGVDCVVIEQATGPAPICPEGVSLELWPPNHAYRQLDLDVLAGVTDPSGLPVTIEITAITQDEPVQGEGGTVCDGTGVGSSVASIRAERQGTGNGRVYRVSYTATNSAGASCDGSIEVTVPKSRNGAPAVDDGQLYDSTEGC